ncbi:MAG: hypothetical protein ACYTFG_05595 [Planctomycetota bacterium]|jgi:hypothetical protein
MVRHVLPFVLFASFTWGHFSALGASESPSRARITVLPDGAGGRSKARPPDFVFTAGPDLWFGGRDEVDPGFTVAADGFLLSGSLRLSFFLEAGGITHRSNRLEERPFTRDLGGEVVQYIALVRVEEESIRFTGSGGLSLSLIGQWSRGGTIVASVGGGGTLKGSRWGGTLRGSVLMGWKDGPSFAGIRLGASARWTDGFDATFTVGIGLGFAFR